MLAPGEKEAKAEELGLTGTGESLKSPISSGLLLGDRAQHPLVAAGFRTNPRHQKEGFND